MFHINCKKSRLVPTQGMNYNLRLGMVFITEKKLAKVIVVAGGLSQVN